MQPKTQKAGALNQMVDRAPVSVFVFTAKETAGALFAEFLMKLVR
jgi:hypothetical protein